MATAKIISILLLCIGLCECNNMQQVCTFWKGVYYPASWRRLVFDRHSFQASKLLYAVCDPTSTGKQCMVVRDKDEPFQGGNYTCSMSIKPSLRGGVLGEKFQVIPFGEDKAILSFLERTNTETKLGLTTVKFSDCSWHEIRMPVGHSFDDRLVFDNFEILPYQNTYDVLFVNTRECGDKYCKVSVNFDTHSVSERPTPWFPIDHSNGNNIMDVKTIGAEDKGAVVIENNANECRVSILQGNAKKILKVYSTSGGSSVASSTSNDLIATCHMSSGTLNCAQYDQSGATIVESTNQLEGNLVVKAVHNLRGGAGLLALLSNKIENRNYVLRVDMSGKKVGKIDVNKFECDQNQNDVAGNFWEKDEQYCVSLACYESDEVLARKSDKGHLSAHAKCFFLRNLEPIS